jgi:hypothetical protein
VEAHHRMLWKINVKLLQAQDDKIQGQNASYEHIKNTLDARHIIERFERDYLEPRTRGVTRAMRWNNYFEKDPAFHKKLQGCRNIEWAKKIEAFYTTLSEEIPSIDLGGERYKVRIKKTLPEDLFCFIEIISKELYGSHVELEQMDG